MFDKTGKVFCIYYNVNRKSYALSYGDISNNLYGPLTRLQGHNIFWSQIYLKNGAFQGQSYYRTLIGI